MPARGATFETVNPFTGRAWAEIPRAGPEDVDEAVSAPARRSTTAGGRAPAARSLAIAVPPFRLVSRRARRSDVIRHCERISRETLGR